MASLPKTPSEPDARLTGARRRAIQAAWATAVGVVATGASTLVLIHAADPAVHAPALWAVVFFAGAQVAALCTVLAVLQAIRMRRRAADTDAADIALLCRRCAVAFVAAGVTMFAAGAAVAGQASALALLSGPALACVGAVMTVRAWAAARRLGGAHPWAQRSPLADVAALTGRRLPPVGPATIAMVAAVAAFVRDRGEAGATTVGSLGVAAVEAALVVGAYLALRGPLGLRGYRTRIGLYS